MAKKKPERRRPIDKVTADLMGQVPEPEPEPPKKPDTRDKPMTWRVGEATSKRVNAIAEDLNVEKSGLVKVLLNYALDAIENGDLDVDEYVRLRKRPRKLDI